MPGFHTHLENETVNNQNFRKVLFTANNTQLVVMSLEPGQDIGMEIHPDNDQFFRVDQGEGKAIINDQEFILQDGDAIIIPAGAEHNIINTSQEAYLKLYTLYSPPHHPDGTIHPTKADAIAAEEAEGH
jgi:mannose-6-phosphate isomerase-like protein (cupin superfamily)